MNGMKNTKPIPIINVWPPIRKTNPTNNITIIMQKVSVKYTYLASNFKMLNDAKKYNIQKLRYQGFNKEEMRSLVD